MSQLWTSTAFIITLIVGLVISVAYLRYMWLALQRAVQTRDDADLGSDNYRYSLAGAVIAVFGSATAIGVYGAAPTLLYVGPGLALLSALAVTFCLRSEFQDD